MIWYSLSVSVRAGATVIESPVMPRPWDRRFSMEHTMMQLSALSRTPPSRTPSSRARSPRSAPGAFGEASSPRSTISANSSGVADAAAGAAERERGTDDGGQAHVLDRWQVPSARLCARYRLRRGETDPRHRLAKQLAILGHGDGPEPWRDHLDAVLRQHALLIDGRAPC